MADIPQNTSYGSTGNLGQATAEAMKRLQERVQSELAKPTPTAPAQSQSFTGPYRPNASAPDPYAVRDEANKYLGAPVGPAPVSSTPAPRLVNVPEGQKFIKAGTQPNVVDPSATTQVRNWPGDLGGGQYYIDQGQPGKLIKSDRVIGNPDLGGSFKDKMLLRNGFSPKEYEIDHTVPLWAGGVDSPQNLQILPIRQHAEKTAAQAVAMSLYYNGDIDLNEARGLANTWDRRDTSPLQSEIDGFVKSRTGGPDMQINIDKARAKEIYDQWKKQEIVTAKSPTFTEVLKGIPEAAKNWGEGWMPNFLREFIKGTASGATMGLLPYQADDGSTNVDKISGAAGQIAGTVLGFGKFRVAYMGMARLLGKRLPWVTSALIPSRVAGVKQLPWAGGRSIPVSAKNVAIGKAKNFMANAAKEAAVFGTYGQVSQGLSGITAADEDSGLAGFFDAEKHLDRVIPDLAFGGLLGSAGHNIRGYSGVGAGSLVIGMLEGMPAKDNMINAIIMTGMHGLGHRAGRVKMENLVDETATRMSYDHLNKYLPNEIPKVDPNKPIPLKKYTEQEIETLRQKAAEEIGVVAEREGMDLHEQGNELAKTLAALRQLYKGGMSSAERKVADMIDIRSTAKKTISKDSDVESIGTPDSLKKFMETVDDGVVWGKVNSESAAPGSFPVGESRVTGIASSINGGINRKNFYTFLRASQEGRAAPKLILVERSDLKSFFEKTNQRITPEQEAALERSKMKNPQNSVQAFSLIRKPEGGMEMLPLGWMPREFRISDSQFAINKGEWIKRPDNPKGVYEPQDPSFNKDTIAEAMKDNGIGVLPVDISVARTAKVSGEPILVIKITDGNWRTAKDAASGKFNKKVEPTSPLDTAKEAAAKKKETNDTINALKGALKKSKTSKKQLKISGEDAIHESPKGKKTVRLTGKKAVGLDGQTYLSVEGPDGYVPAKEVRPISSKEAPKAESTVQDKMRRGESFTLDEFKKGFIDAKTVPEQKIVVQKANKKAVEKENKTTARKIVDAVKKQKEEYGGENDGGTDLAPEQIRTAKNEADAVKPSPVVEQPPAQNKIPGTTYVIGGKAVTFEKGAEAKYAEDKVKFQEKFETAKKVSTEKKAAIEAEIEAIKQRSPMANYVVGVKSRGAAPEGQVIPKLNKQETADAKRLTELFAERKDLQQPKLDAPKPLSVEKMAAGNKGREGQLTAKEAAQKRADVESALRVEMETAIEGVMGGGGAKERAKSGLSRDAFTDMMQNAINSAELQNRGGLPLSEYNLIRNSARKSARVKASEYINNAYTPDNEIQFKTGSEPASPEVKQIMTKFIKGETDVRLGLRPEPLQNDVAVLEKAWESLYPGRKMPNWVTGAAGTPKQPKDMEAFRDSVAAAVRTDATDYFKKMDANIQKNPNTYQHGWAKQLHEMFKLAFGPNYRKDYQLAKTLSDKSKSGREYYDALYNPLDERTGQYRSQPVEYLKLLERGDKKALKEFGKERATELDIAKEGRTKPDLSESNLAESKLDQESLQGMGIRDVSQMEGMVQDLTARELNLPGMLAAEQDGIWSAARGAIDARSMFFGNSKAPGILSRYNELLRARAKSKGETYTGKNISKENWKKNEEEIKLAEEKFNKDLKEQVEKLGIEEEMELARKEAGGGPGFGKGGIGDFWGGIKSALGMSKPQAEAPTVLTKPQNMLPPPKPKSYKVRGLDVYDADIDEAANIMYGEISNRAPERQQFEVRNIINTAINRANENPKYYDSSLTKVLQRPYQYQGYAPDGMTVSGGKKVESQYQKVKSGAIDESGQKKLKLIKDTLNELRAEDFKDTTDGSTFYVHASDGTMWLGKTLEEAKRNANNHEKSIKGKQTRWGTAVGLPSHLAQR